MLRRDGAGVVMPGCSCGTARRKCAWAVGSWWFEAFFFVLVLVAGQACAVQGGESVLFAAVKANDLSELRLLLERGRHAAAVANDDGVTPLHIAAALNQKEAAELLLEHSADPNAVAKAGTTPLHWAACRDSVAVARLLLKAGADPAVVTAAGVTPFALAVSKGASNVAQLLGSWNPENELRDDFFAAVRAGDCAAVRGMLKKRSDLVHAVAADGVTPLHLAAALDLKEMAALLLEGGANPAARAKADSTPLHWAACRNSAAVAELLLMAGANSSAVTSEGATALNWAVAKGAENVVQVLNTKDPRVLAKDQFFSAVKSGGTSKVRKILKKYPDFARARAADDVTPLHLAAALNQASVAALLVEYAADPNAVAKAGTTPLHWAACRNSAGVAEILLKAGADTSAVGGNGQTPLDLAFSKGSARVVPLLTRPVVERAPEKTDVPAAVVETAKPVQTSGAEVELVQTLIPEPEAEAVAKQRAVRPGLFSQLFGWLGKGSRAAGPEDEKGTAPSPAGTTLPSNEVAAAAAPVIIPDQAPGTPTNQVVVKEELVPEVIAEPGPDDAGRSRQQSGGLFNRMFGWLSSSKKQAVPSAEDAVNRDAAGAAPQTNGTPAAVAPAVSVGAVAEAVTNRLAAALAADVVPSFIPPPRLGEASGRRKWSVSLGVVRQWGARLNLRGQGTSLARDNFQALPGGRGTFRSNESTVRDTTPGSGFIADNTAQYANRTFSDGFVWKDIWTEDPLVPADRVGTTWNWGYQDASQYDARAGLQSLTFHRTGTYREPDIITSYDETRSSQDVLVERAVSAYDNIPQDGLQFAVRREILEIGKWQFGLDFNLAWFPETDTSASDIPFEMTAEEKTYRVTERVRGGNSTVSETFVYADRFGRADPTLLPLTDPTVAPPPYAGAGLVGPGPLIPNLPEAYNYQVLSSTPSPGTEHTEELTSSRSWHVTDQVSVDGEVERLRLGGGISLARPVGDRLTVSVRPALTLNLVQAELNRQESVLVTDDQSGQSTVVASSSIDRRKSGFIPGFQLVLDLNFRFWDLWFIGAYASREWLIDDFEMQLGPDMIEMDLGGTEASLYLGRQF